MVRKFFAALALAVLVAAVGMVSIGCAPDEPAPTPMPEIPADPPAEEEAEDAEERPAPQPDQPLVPMPD